MNDRRRQEQACATYIEEFAMPFKLGAPELIIILVIVIVLFGTSRISTIGRDLGAAIREFRKGMGSDEAKKKEEETPNKEQ